MHVLGCRTKAVRLGNLPLDCLHASVVISIARCVLRLKVLPPLLPMYDALQRVIEFRDRIGFGENAVETIVSAVVHHLGLGISP